MPPELTAWATPTGWALAALLFTLMAVGKLVPVTWVNRMLEQERRRGDDLKAANDMSNARADKLLEQQDKLLTYAQSADSALTALRHAAERAGR